VGGEGGDHEEIMPLRDDSALMGALAAQDRYGDDAIVPPTPNPLQPPQWLGEALAKPVRHTWDWFALPGAVARGTRPQTPGQWSEEDQFRENVLRDRARDWGAATGFAAVFDPFAVRRPVGASLGSAGGRAVIPGRTYEGPWGVGRETPMPSVSTGGPTTDAALAAIRQAYQAGRPPNSGVPLIRPREGPPPTVEEALAAIHKERRKIGDLARQDDYEP
jgi:hypothetical protein